MADFTQKLNRDGDKVRTSARFDATAGKWMHDMATGDGQDVAQGSTTDLPVADPTQAATMIALLKGLQSIVGIVAANPTANTVQDRLKGLADRIGEVAAAPTANTLLARLKALEGYVDGLEAAIGTTADGAAAGNGSLIAVLKHVRDTLASAWDGAAGALKVKVTGSIVSTATMQNAAAVAGNGVALSVDGLSICAFTVTGVFVGTITFEGTTNGADWFPIMATAMGAGTIASTATAPGIFRATVTGLTQVRARISAYTSGAITVTGRAMAGDAPPKAMQVAGNLPAGANEIGAVKQGTAAAESAPWTVKQTDRIAAAPVVGAKTVATTAAELFAGGARLANRISMTVYNESASIVYFGPSGVTVSTGFPLLPGDSVTFQFRPSTATPVYFIAAASSAVRVVELA